MSFRRKKQEAVEARRWREFVELNADLFQRSGVPQSIYTSREMFDDLLMHGYIDHHEDPTHFFVGQLNAEQAECLIEAAARYLRAGFPDPGLALMIPHSREEIYRRAGLPDPRRVTSRR